MAEGVRRTSRWWLASLAGLALLLVAVGVQKLWSADFWWQIRNGQWIVEHRSVPTQEMYSHTAAGTPLREMRWAYCAAVYLLWTQAGAWALVLMQAMAVAGIWGLVVWPVRRALMTPLGATVIGLGLFAGFGRWVVRPEMISYAMAATYLVMLDRSRREPGWRGIWTLPLLQVAWVNGHTTFLFGPMLACVFAGAGWVEAVVARRAGSERAAPGWQPAVVALLTTAACWVNPYGHWGAMYALQMYRETSSDHATARVITEMRSPFAIPIGAWGWDFFATAALILIGAATFAARRSLLPLSRALVFAMGAYLFVMLQRNTALTAVLCGWACLWNLSDLIRPGGGHWFGTKVGPSNALVGVGAACLAWYVATDRYAARFDLPREFGFGVVEWYQPRGAERFLLEEKPAGRLFNIMRDGSYFVWRVSDSLPVYIDGRTDAYGPAMLEELAGVSATNFAALAAKRGISTAVLPSRGYEDVVGWLNSSPEWALVHLGPVSMVFVRRVAEHEALIARHGIDASTWPGPPDGFDEAPPAWRRSLGCVQRSWRSIGMADALTSLGVDEAARPYLELAARASHVPTRIVVQLAASRLAEGRADDAAMLLARLEDSGRAGAYREAARLCMKAGNLRGALPLLVHAATLSPADTQIRLARADALFQLGEFAAARDAYRELLDAGNGGPSEWAKIGAACDGMIDLEGAIVAYKNSLQLQPEQPGVWNLLGAAYARTGDLASAGKCFENALKLKPDFDAARRNLEKLRAMTD